MIVITSVILSSSNTVRTTEPGKGGRDMLILFNNSFPQFIMSSERLSLSLLLYILLSEPKDDSNLSSCLGPFSNSFSTFLLSLSG